MIQLSVCPSTLAEGSDTYSPSAQKMLFDGAKVSHILHVPSPASDTKEAKEAVENAGRISLSGVQPKFSIVVGSDSVMRYTVEGEQGTYILKPRPNSYQLLNRDYCVANEHLTMQIASQVYNIETAANGLCFYSDGEAAYFTRRFDVHSGGKYQQEDFASLMGYTKANGGSDYKYCNASYEECAEVISRYVKASRIDLLRFFRLVLFNCKSPLVTLSIHSWLSRYQRTVFSMPSSNCRDLQRFCEILQINYGNCWKRYIFKFIEMVIFCHYVFSIGCYCTVHELIVILVCCN